MNLRKYNRHWERNFRYPYPKTREIYNELIKSIDQRFIVELVGLRRTGKTVLLFQTINYLLDHGVNPTSILYFTYDEEQVKLEQLLDEFRAISEIGNERIYVFLDEVQKLPNFEGQVKVFYDLYPNIKFFLSGSSSLYIKKKSRESLAGRTRTFYLGPLCFREYLKFVEKDYLLENPSAFIPDIKIEFEKFIQNQFIEAIYIQDGSEKKEYYKSIIKKIVFEDIPHLFPIEYPELMYRIVKILAYKPGILIDYSSLSNDLGVSNKTVSSYLSFLTDSFLVMKVYNFSTNLLSSEKKLKKFYLASPSFSWSLAEYIDKGALVENLVLSIKRYRYFWRDPYKREVDFIALTDEDIPIPIEIKYKEGISRNDLKGIRAFSKKFDVSKGVILYKGDKKEQINLPNLTVEVSPIYWHV